MVPSLKSPLRSPGLLGTELIFLFKNEARSLTERVHVYIYKSCHDDILFIPLFPFPLLGKSRSSQQAVWRERKQESPFKSKLQMQVALVEAPRGGRFLSTRAGPGGLASPDLAHQIPTPNATRERAGGDRQGVALALHHWFVPAEGLSSLL